MRTTIVIDDLLERRLRSLVSKKKLSHFINECLREHFQREENRKHLQLLEKAYQRAAKFKGAEDLEGLDQEDWLEW